MTDEPDPVTYNQAITSSHSDEWLTAMHSELLARHANQTWSATLLPPNRKSVKTKWVFVTKPGHSPHTPKRKGRVVAKGFSQKYGIDYEETFAPTVKHTTIRLVLSYAASHNKVIHQADVDTAFLNAALKEEIYIDLPPGANLVSHLNTELVPSPSLIQESKCSGQPIVGRLHKALYGLKQSPRDWRLGLMIN